MRVPRSARAWLTAAVAAVALAGCSSGGEAPASPSPSVASSTSSTSTVTSPAATPTTPSQTSAPARRTTTKPMMKPTTKPKSKPKPKPLPTRTSSARPSTSSTAVRPRAGRLPLALPTADARQVVTVVTDGPGDTTGTLQRWRKVAGGWRTVGPPSSAYVGSGGVGQASEGSTRTPAGSFTLTQAFGRNGNPGTRLPYFATNPSDYWISNSGPLYNTHQRCGSCGYERGINEHLYSIVPEYQQAVVIDYNTRNAPGGVRQGAGSAFFLHATGGEPTAGCVAIDLGRLVDVMRWLDPRQHPRILIGTR
ncbi:L,D-transpeptidase family protein [Jatrophihabitans fulvus]